MEYTGDRNVRLAVAATVYRPSIISNDFSLWPCGSRRVPSIRLQRMPWELELSLVFSISVTLNISRKRKWCWICVHPESPRFQEYCCLVSPGLFNKDQEVWLCQPDHAPAKAVTELNEILPKESASEPGEPGEPLGRNDRRASSWWRIKDRSPNGRQLLITLHILQIC
jgi:hypothetical protein